MAELGIQRHRIYACASRFFGRDDIVLKTAMYRRLPRGVLTPSSQINPKFLPLVAADLAQLFTGGISRSSDLAAELQQKGLVCGTVDESHTYEALMARQLLLDRLAVLPFRNRQLFALQSMVTRLGHDLNENLRVAMNCIRGVFGFSGVRIYEVDLVNGTYHHLCSKGEKGKSRFEEPKAPPEKSEKQFVLDLRRGNVPALDIETAGASKLYEWTQD
ncbi:MAG TPA: hypothetical protein VMT55_02810, partial [Candidatus Sulfotelmatobacter sp.]|nr:hypothetical protein [Candidatus Sulfotelmatobacter sp.]